MLHETIGLLAAADEDRVKGLPFIGGVPKRHWQHAPALQSVALDLTHLLTGELPPLLRPPPAAWSCGVCLELNTCTQS